MHALKLRFCKLKRKIDMPFKMAHLHLRLWSYLHLHLYGQTSLKYLKPTLEQDRCKIIVK